MLFAFMLMGAVGMQLHLGRSFYKSQVLEGSLMSWWAMWRHTRYFINYPSRDLRITEGPFHRQQAAEWLMRLAGHFIKRRRPVAHTDAFHQTWRKNAGTADQCSTHTWPFHK